MSSDTGTVTSSPIYETLAERLRQAIRSGEYGPGELIGSEHELARQENISRMTVRRASELLVNEGLLERRPGKGLYVREEHVSTRLIQVVAGNLRWEPCLQVARGVQDAAKRMGIQVQLYDAHGSEQLDLEVVRDLPTGPARGAVIVALHGTAFSEAVYGLRTKGYPFVLVDQQLQDIDVPSVMADNATGGFMVGEAIAALGHRRVAFIGDLIAGTTRDRLAGFRDAIGDAGLPFDRSLVMDLPVDQNRLGDWSTPAEEATRAVMAKPHPPTAIFCSCDAVARSVYRALSKLGLRVPEQVSVVGFDDDPLAEWLTPPLTTVLQPFEAMGRAALTLLCERMTNPQAPAQHQLLAVKLIRRASLARCLTP